MGAGIAQGVEGGFKTYTENSLRNRALQGANNALLAQFMNDPEAKKYAPEGLDKYIEKSVKGGGLSLNDNVTLNGLLNTTIATKNAIMGQQEKAQEMELRKQQMAMNEVQMQEAKRKAAMQAEQQSQLEKLKQFSNLSQTNGVLRADVQDGMAKRIEQNPFLKAQMQAMQAGGALPPDTLAQFVTANQKAGAAPIKFETYRTTGPKGEPIEVTIDARTGKEIGRGPITQVKNVLMPEEQGAAEYAKKRGEGDAAMVADVQSRVPQFQNTLDQTKRARSLIASDAKQGRGREAVTEVQKAVNLVVPNLFDTTKEEALQKSYADMALDASAKMKGQGQITQPERELLAKTVAQYGNSKEAALYVMDFMDAVAKREMEKADHFANVEADEGRVTSKHNTMFYREHPLEKYMTSTAPTTETKGGTTAPLEIKSIKLVK